MNEVLDKMNLSRIERSDPQQFVQAILLNVNYGTSTGKFSFYDFLVYGLFLQKKEANVESTSSEIKEAQKKGTNTTNVLKRHLINTPAYDLLFLNFSDNVIEYKKLFENKQRRDEALTTKRVHLSSDACLILNVSKDNPVIGHLPLFKEDSLGREPELSGNRHRSNVTSINFWKPPVLLPLSSIDGFEAANFHCSTYRRFEEASFLNNLNVEDFLRVAESPPSFFVQSELQNSCTNIPSTGERKEEILTTAFDQDVSEWITRNVAEIDYQNLMLPL